MQKKIMILGAGIYQVPLIKKAKSKGLEVIVVSPNRGYPGIELADVYLDIDTVDSDSILDEAKKYSISGIATTGSDVCLPTLGKVVDALGLSGTGYDAACKSMDKVLMKQAFMDHGVLNAKFKYFTSKSKAKNYAEHTGYPVMVKATDSSGSRGVSKVNSNSEFDDAWNKAILVSRSKEIIIEEYLRGAEFGAQVFIQNNKVINIFLHNDTVTTESFYTPIGHSMPKLISADLQIATIAIIEKAVNALGINNCISNVDLMIVDNNPVIIEMGARMGATCIPENISIYSGDDAYDYAIDLALGYKRDYIISAKQANASLLLTSNKSGIISAINIPWQVREHSDLLDLQLDVSVGDSVNKFKVGPDRIGHIIVKGSNAEDCEKLAEWMASIINVIVD